MSVITNIIHMLAPLTANCREFHQRWEQAPLAGAGAVAGCWEGEWISDASGHRGRLRCVIDPVTPILWRMYFRGEYSKVFRACYATDFNVTEEADRWRFSGGSDLGALAGGAYEYAGSATRERLACTYRSSRDHGQFMLTKFSSTVPASKLGVGSWRLEVDS